MARSASREAALGLVFDALANEQRRSILLRLARGPASTTEVASRFAFTKQALSRHLIVLENAGLIARSTQGRAHDLTLLPAAFEDVSQWLTQLRRGWHASFDRLERILRSK